MKKFGLLLCMVATVCMLGGCFHKHEWKEATCTEPRTCINCGATEGVKNGHFFKEATCTEPKICTMCGYKEGEPLGHTCLFGTCERCGEKCHDEETAKSLVLRSSSMFEHLEKAGNQVTNSVDDYLTDGDCAKAYDDLDLAYEEFAKAREDLETMISICGNNKELGELKSAAQNLRMIIPIAENQLKDEFGLSYRWRRISGKCEKMVEYMLKITVSMINMELFNEDAENNIDMDIWTNLEELEEM